MCWSQRFRQVQRGDAIAWAWVNIKVPSLRGGKMDDVIFAGTPEGAAWSGRVILTIDNADGALNIDYSEVTISHVVPVGRF